MIAFVHINKTAGTTLYHILRQSFGASHCDIKLWPRDSKDERELSYRTISARDIQRTRSVYWGLKSIAGHRVTAFGDMHEQLKDVRYYTFVREPMHRCASHFQFIKKRKSNQESFEDWIQKEHYRNVQCRKIAGEANSEKAIAIIRDRVSFVGIQELFDESLVMFQKWVRPYEIDIRYKSQNVASGGGLKNKVLEDPAKRSLMEEANQEDLKLYRYVSDVIWPEQVAKWSSNLEEEVAELQEQNRLFVTKKEPIQGSLIRNLLYKPLLPVLSRGKIFTA